MLKFLLLFIPNLLASKVIAEKLGEILGLDYGPRNDLRLIEKQGCNWFVRFFDGQANLEKQINFATPYKLEKPLLDPKQRYGLAFNENNSLLRFDMTVSDKEIFPEAIFQGEMACNYKLFDIDYNGDYVIFTAAKEPEDNEEKETLLYFFNVMNKNHTIYRFNSLIDEGRFSKDLQYVFLAKKNALKDKYLSLFALNYNHKEKNFFILLPEKKSIYNYCDVGDNKILFLDNNQKQVLLYDFVQGDISIIKTANDKEIITDFFFRGKSGQDYFVDLEVYDADEALFSLKKDDVKKRIWPSKFKNANKIGNFKYLFKNDDMEISYQGLLFASSIKIPLKIYWFDFDKKEFKSFYKEKAKVAPSNLEFLNLENSIFPNLSVRIYKPELEQEKFKTIFFLDDLKPNNRGIGGYSSYINFWVDSGFAVIDLPYPGIDGLFLDKLGKLNQIKKFSSFFSDILESVLGSYEFCEQDNLLGVGNGLGADIILMMLTDSFANIRTNFLKAGFLIDGYFFDNNSGLKKYDLFAIEELSKLHNPLAILNTKSEYNCNSLLLKKNCLTLDKKIMYLQTLENFNHANLDQKVALFFKEFWNQLTQNKIVEVFEVEVPAINNEPEEVSLDSSSDEEVLKKEFYDSRSRLRNNPSVRFNNSENHQIYQESFGESPEPKNRKSLKKLTSSVTKISKINLTEIVENENFENEKNLDEEKIDEIETIVTKTPLTVVVEQKALIVIPADSEDNFIKTESKSPTEILLNNENKEEQPTGEDPTKDKNEQPLKPENNTTIDSTLEKKEEQPIIESPAKDKNEQTLEKEKNTQIDSNLETKESVFSKTLEKSNVNTAETSKDKILLSPRTSRFSSFKKKEKLDDSKKSKEKKSSLNDIFRRTNK